MTSIRKRRDNNSNLEEKTSGGIIVGVGTKNKNKQSSPPPPTHTSHRLLSSSCDSLSFFFLLGGTFFFLLLVVATGSNTQTTTTTTTTTTTSKSKTMNTAAVKAAAASLSPMVKQSYKLLKKTRLSHDSFLLKYELPTPASILGSDPFLPTCIKVDYNDAPAMTATATKKKNKPLSKSYSPISHPSDRGSFEMIVKSYEYQPGGGVGKYLCEMEIGQSIDATLKSKRMMHDSPDVIGRGWKRVGLVGGGTGIAPLLQIARIILQEDENNDGDDETKVYLLFINHTEEDILGRTIIDGLARDHPNRFFVRYALTGQKKEDEEEKKEDENSTAFLYGRGDAAMARAALPPPSEEDGGSTMILVCGKDGFVEHWAGPVGRAPNKPDGTKGAKIQGPLLGVLADAGYTADQVFKY